jgi:uncharacterized protein YlxP (DUF503 family)
LNYIGSACISNEEKKLQSIIEEASKSVDQFSEFDIELIDEQGI